MRAITLTQPWATLVAIGAKRIETRSWATSYRGPLAIHAATGLGPVGGKKGLRDLCCRDPFFNALRNGGIDLDQVDVDVLPFGAIVAVCDLVACEEMDPEEDAALGGWWKIIGGKRMHWALTAQEHAFGDYSPGRYAWLLTDVRALPEPIPARGALGLWNYEGEA